MSAAPRRSRAGLGAAWLIVAIATGGCTMTITTTAVAPQPVSGVPGASTRPALVPDAPTLVEAWTTPGASEDTGTGGGPAPSGGTAMLTGHVRVLAPQPDGSMSVLGRLDSVPFPGSATSDPLRLCGLTRALARPGNPDLVIVTYPSDGAPRYVRWAPGSDPSPLAPPPGWPADPRTGMLRSPDGTTIAALDADVLLWNTASGGVRTIPVHSRDRWTGRLVRWLEDGRLLLARDEAVTAGKAAAFRARYQILDVATGTIADATPDGPLGAEALDTSSVLSSAGAGIEIVGPSGTTNVPWTGTIDFAWLTSDTLWFFASKGTSASDAGPWSVYRIPLTHDGAPVGGASPTLVGTGPAGYLPSSGTVLDSVVVVGEEAWAYVCPRGTGGPCELAALHAGRIYRMPPDGVVTHRSWLVAPSP